MQKWGRNVQNAYHKLWRKTKGTVKCIFSTYAGLLAECGKKWKIVRKILPNSAGNSAEKSEIVRENAK